MKQASKKEDTKQRILDEALRLFSQSGYDAVSVERIASAVGIKAPSLYKHFKSKQEIFDAIVAKTYRRYDIFTDGIDVHVSESKADEKCLTVFPRKCLQKGKTAYRIFTA